jgi:hypothetical protein
MYDIGRAEAARFELHVHSKCFERHSKVLRATQQKGWAPFRSLIPLTPYFRPRGSGGGPDLRITQKQGRGGISSDPVSRHTDNNG